MMSLWRQIGNTGLESMNWWKADFKTGPFSKDSSRSLYPEKLDVEITGLARHLGFCKVRSRGREIPAPLAGDLLDCAD